MTDLRTAAQQALEALEKVKHGQWEEDSREGRALITALRAALEQPEQDVPETDCGNMQVEWADIPKEFNDWWDADRLTQTNPFREDSPAYWAWEGWQARTALEQPEQEQEPVAWMDPNRGEVCRAHWLESHAPERDVDRFSCPLYTHPPRREWRGLDKDETMHLMNDTAENYWADEAHIQRFSRAVEAALRSKNYE